MKLVLTCMKKALEKVHVVAEVEEGAAAVVGEGAPKADAGRDARDVGREEAYSAVVVDHCAPRKQLAWFLHKDVGLANPSTNGIMRFECIVHLFATFPFSAAV